MAMPRPSGRARRIAGNVIPGLKAKRNTRKKVKDISSSFLSEVEIKQTRNIENKEGLT